MVSDVKKPDHAGDIRLSRLARKGRDRAIYSSEAIYKSVAEVERPARASGGGCAPDADLAYRRSLGQAVRMRRSELRETSAFDFALTAFQIIDADSAVQIFKLCLMAAFATRQQFKKLIHGIYSVVPSLL